MTSTMVNVVSEILIEYPLEEVARYAADPDNAPEWYTNIQSAEWKTPKPLSVGSQILFKANFLGRELNYTYEVIEYSHLKKLIMRTSNGPFPMETEYTWSDSKKGETRMTLSNKGMPKGFSKLAAPMMVSSMKRANKKDLERLKSILENMKEEALQA